ncbi:uncharacterized protein A4U43_C04F18180 [Asparagus officinalis]|uniref:DUF668 domain-containing protein n=2 Tax=Asparagus officinalis TaxID=4686 RepID=A0A5P1F4I4_ASPOF|nr:uncharacterized protein A4U43_C04F18180 [Asparagus officinalis]
MHNSTSVNFLYSAKDLDSAVRKMERYVASTAALYAELEVLSDLEHSAKKFPVTDETRRAFDQKIQWQRHDIKQIRDSSLWNQSFDKAVLLLARAVCTIHARIRSVFGEYVPGVKSSDSGVSGQIVRSGEVQRSGLILFGSDVSGQIARSGEVQRSGLVVNSGLSLHREGLRLHCGASPGKLFLNCLSLGSSGSWNYNEDYIETESTVMPFTGEIKSNLGVDDGKFSFGPKSRLTTLAPPSTVGGSCLALHYANIIIIIEKLLRYPHLVGEDARDDLYQMLPSSLRLGLRKSLKSYVKNLAIYDASLAHDWKEAMERILGWLAPMAHNMIRWQTERNFEQHQIVLKESVLLLQSIYFADRVKAEAAICELLVGLNYICRYEQQQNALLDCRSSLDFDDCMEWQQMPFDSAERL